MNQITDNYKKKQVVRAALILSDLLSVLMPSLLIYTFNENIGGFERYRTATLLGVLLFAFSILFCSQTIYEQYTARRSFYDEFKELLQLYIFNSLAVLSALFVFGLSVERQKHLIFLFSVFVLIPIFRYFSRKILDLLGLWRIDCLIFSPRSEFKFAKTAIESQFNLGMAVRRSGLENRLLINLINKTEQQNFTNFNSLKEQIHTYYLSIGRPHIIIFSNRKNAIYVPKIVELLILCGLPYSIIPDVGGVSLLGTRISHFFRWEVLLITPQNNLQRASYKILKRIFDIAISTVCLILFAIPMMVIYFFVRMDGGPSIYVHQRVGHNGKFFNCYKFRSMQINSEHLLKDYLKQSKDASSAWERNQKLINDPRVTPLGKILRSSSLDELPQLFNVLRGDMSLVGPRPIEKSEIAKYGQSFELYKKVRPGITGLWQISGRSNTTYSYRVALDLWYIKNWSLWYDIAILFRTVGVIVNRTGAY